MASNSTEFSKTEVDIRICGICKEQKQDPKELPCKHVSYCRKCLEEKSLQNENKTMSCPKCNEIVNLSGASAFVDDYYAMNLIIAKDKEDSAVRCSIHENKLVNHICFDCHKAVCEDCIDIFAKETNFHAKHTVRDFKTALKSLNHYEKTAEDAKQLLSHCNDSMKNMTTNYMQVAERKRQELCNYINEHMKEVEKFILFDFRSTRNELEEHMSCLEKLVIELKNIDARFNEQDSASDVSDASSSKTIADTVNLLKEMDNCVKKLKKCEQLIESKRNGIRFNHRSLDSRAENSNNSIFELICHFVGTVEKGFRIDPFPNLNRNIKVTELPVVLSAQIRGLQFENEDGYTVYDSRDNALHRFSNSLHKLQTTYPTCSAMKDVLKPGDTFFYRIVNNEHDPNQNKFADVFVTPKENKREIYAVNSKQRLRLIDEKLMAISHPRKWALLPLRALWSEARLAQRRHLNEDYKTSVECAHAYVSYDVFKESAIIHFCSSDNLEPVEVKSYYCDMSNLYHPAVTNNNDNETQSTADTTIQSEDLLLAASDKFEEFAITCLEMGEVLKVDREGKVALTYSPQDNQFIFTGACFNHLDHLILATKKKTDCDETQHIFRVEILNNKGQLISYFEPTIPHMINDNHMGSLAYLSANEKGNIILMSEGGYGCTFKLPQHDLEELV